MVFIPGMCAAVVMVDTVVKDNTSVMQSTYIFVSFFFIDNPLKENRDLNYNKILLRYLYKTKEFIVIIIHYNENAVSFSSYCRIVLRSVQPSFSMTA